MLPSQQFGALPLHSATDLVTAAVHDIEEAWTQGKIASILTLNVQGAFDSVLPGRLIHRLQEQRWPHNIQKWVASFLTDRSATLKLDGTMSDPLLLSCGLPQGSPASPVLFMLYIEPLFRIGPLERHKSRFGYADDLCLLATSHSFSTNCDILENDYTELATWASSEGLTFDSGKSELLHLTRKRTSENPPISLRSSPSTHRISPTSTKESLKWLGVHFDHRLSFTIHAKTMAAKAHPIASHIRSLSNTVRGARPHLL